MMIKKEALRLGFNDCGISRAEFLGLESKRLESWLNKGYHAGLGYMERNKEKRTSLFQLAVDMGQVPKAFDR